jgi:hypothetical protein
LGFPDFGVQVRVHHSRTHRRANLIRSRRWPIVKATAVSADCPEPEYGCIVATLYYEYVLNGDKYGDTFEKPFIEHESGADYAELFAKGLGINIHVKASQPAKSVPAWCAPFVV